MYEFYSLLNNCLMTGFYTVNNSIPNNTTTNNMNTNNIITNKYSNIDEV